MNDINSNKTMTRRVALVTGATGFIGSHLALNLARDGWEVHILMRANSRLPKLLDFTQLTHHIYDGSSEAIVHCLAQAKPDVVFHLASLFLSQHVTKDIEPLIASNILFGNQLLDAMRINKATYFINTGTSWQHYENDDYNPVCLYAATKQAFEDILDYYVQACGIKAVTLKLFDTYGPNDLRQKLFYLLSNAAKTAEPLDMSMGEQLIDLVHIDDVIEAYKITAQRLLDGRVSKHERYAISSGTPLSLKELVTAYVEATGHNISVNWGARPYRDREVMTPWNKGENLPYWKPKTSYVNEIKRLFEKI